MTELDKDLQFAFQRGNTDTSSVAVQDKKINELLNKYRHTSDQQKILKAFDEGHNFIMSDALENPYDNFYGYGMKMRPFGIGTFPNNNTFIEAIQSEIYHNVLKYKKALSDEDIKKFELIDLNPKTYHIVNLHIPSYGPRDNIEYYDVYKNILMDSQEIKETEKDDSITIDIIKSVEEGDNKQYRTRKDIFGSNNGDQEKNNEETQEQLMSIDFFNKDKSSFFIRIKYEHPSGDIFLEVEDAEKERVIDLMGRQPIECFTGHLSNEEIKELSLSLGIKDYEDMSEEEQLEDIKKFEEENPQDSWDNLFLNDIDMIKKNEIKSSL